MKSNRQIPRVSTRGYYDLRTGDALRMGAGYFAHPKHYFEHRVEAPREIAIVIHGMRNDPADAKKKFAVVKKRLRELGHTPLIVGYTYDANVRGAHYAKTEAHALKVANMIASRNGKHLASFILDTRRMWPHTRIRVLAHSLGSVVIASALRRLAHAPGGANAIESVHVFGASLGMRDATSFEMRAALARVVRRRMINCYCPDDGVLQQSVGTSKHGAPIGLCGITPARTRPKNYSQRRLAPRNHRFASYVAAMRAFP